MLARQGFQELQLPSKQGISKQNSVTKIHHKMKVNQNTSILFWLFKAKTSADGKSPIYCRITIEGKRAQFSTGKRIAPDLWDTKLGIAKGRNEEAISINKELNKIIADLQRTYDRLEALQQRVTAEILKNSYQGTGPENKLISEAWQEYNNILLERVHAKEPTMNQDTQERFVVTAGKVMAFLKNKYNTKDKAVRDLKDCFGDDFLHYLTTHDQLSKNTAMKHIKNTKQMLRWATKQGYAKVNPLADFKCTYKDPKRPRLELHELMKMYRTPMPIQRLEEVKDVYIFGCFTGYAYMDLYKLEPENVMPWIDGTKWLIKDRNKGNHTKSNVPLMEIPLAIIEKYKDHPYCLAYNKLLPVNSNQRFNSYIKEVAALCGINKELTTHTARHTFATTVLIESGCSLSATGEMLGHESERTTKIYAKITDVRVAKDIKKVRSNLDERIKKIHSVAG